MTQTEPPTTGNIPDISVVIPAWNEGENIPLLIPRIAAALAGRSWDATIVDDGSKDATQTACAELSKTYPLRLIVREKPEHGLSGAVLHGIAESKGRTIVVMDADLQHPPERLPALVDALDQGADFALGSRYVEGGSTDGQWTLFRKINSGVATVLARPFAGPVQDPMSGFFALRRDTFDRAERLTPLGYKIALELICKCRVKQVKEVPIHFGLRTKGESKLSMKQQFRYLEHLSRLYDFTFPRVSPIVKFVIAIVVGYLAGLIIFAIATIGLSVTGSVVLGYAAVILVTAIFHVRYVRTQRMFLVTTHPWRDFLVISAAECIAVVLVTHWLIAHVIQLPRVELFTIPFICAITVRYVLRKEMLHDIRGLRDPALDRR